MNIEPTPMAARLARIMGDVGRVEKKGQIRSQGSGPSYNFARDSDVLEAVNPKLADAGIVLVPEHTELLSMEPNMRGTQIIANIKTSWHVTDGKESIRFETLGQGQDSGDKALPKAQSNARKYAFFMLFHIVTGDDPDQHASEDQSERGRTAVAGRRQSAHSGSAPAPRTVGEAKMLLAQVGNEHGLSFAQIEGKAKELGVDRGSASVDDLMRVVNAIAQPSNGSAHPETALGEVGEHPTSPDALLESVLEVTGGELVQPSSEAVAEDSASEVDAGSAAPPTADAPPPRPKTPEFEALSSKERVNARAYWQAHPDEEPETLAEQLRVTA